jgi:hypothetical protein
MAMLAHKRFDLLDLMQADDFAVGERAGLGVDVGLFNARDLACGFGQGDIGIEAARIDVCVELLQALLDRRQWRQPAIERALDFDVTLAIQLQALARFRTVDPIDAGRIVALARAPRPRHAPH